MAERKEWVRDIPLEVKSTDDGKRTFRGLLAAWSLDLGNDVIHKGAFKRTIDHWRQRGAKRPISLIDTHNKDSIFAVVGKMTDAVETDEGLDTEWEFIPDDPAAEAAYRRVKGGYITGMSIGYAPVPAAIEWEAGKSGRIRHLHEVKLFEGSLVTFPMNEDARIDTTSVKTLAQWTDMTPDERTAYIAALPDEEKAALRALLAPAPEPAPALAHEDTKQAARNAFLRLNLQQLATRSRGPAPVGQNIATMSDRTDEQHFRKAG